MAASARWKTQWPESGVTGCTVSGFGNSESDMRTFRNCDFKRFETQTGDIRSPPSRASFRCATFVVKVHMT